MITCNDNNNEYIILTYELIRLTICNTMIVVKGGGVHYSMPITGI